MNSYERMFTIIFIVVFLGELVVVTQNKLFDETSVDLLNVAYKSGARVEVTYSIKQGTYANVLEAALTPVSQFSVDKDIYIYYDRDYPTSLVSINGWAGIIDHLEENVRLKDYGGKLEIVNASRLKDLMLQKYDSVLVIPSGVFPETVHTKDSSLVKQYLENGGIMIWIGDIFAAYLGKWHGKIDSLSSENPGLDAQRRILGYVVQNVSEFTSADIETPSSEALCTKYTGIQTGVFVAEVLEHRGMVFGKIKGDRASIGMVPVGNGFLVLFGGGMTLTRSQFGEDLVASDIMNILLSGMLFSNGRISHQEIVRKDASNKTLTVIFNDNWVAGVMFFVVSKDDYSYFFYRQFIPKQ